nr:hypothetical protein [Candidatus Njordarchaeota archaeon]
MTGGNVLDSDAKAVYMRLLAVIDYASQQREMKTCSIKQVDGILEAYSAARTLCHEVTLEGKAIVFLPDLGRIAKGGRYKPSELRAMLTSIEVECFKGIAVLARIIDLIPKKKAAKNQNHN